MKLAFYCGAGSIQTLLQERIIYSDELISLRAEYCLAYSLRAISSFP